MHAEFDRLLALHVPRVHRAAAGMMRNEAEAAEVAQEALARAWAARERYDRARPFYPWLATILRNVGRDRMRRRARRPEFSLDDRRLQSDTPNPLQQLSQRESEEAIRAAIGTLGDNHREILIMRHFEGLAYAEIAEALGVAEGTVMSRLYRARRALVAALRASGDAP